MVSVTLILIYLDLEKKNSCISLDIWYILGTTFPLEEGMATHSNILICRIPIGRGAWQVVVHGVTNIQTQLSD